MRFHLKCSSFENNCFLQVYIISRIMLVVLESDLHLQNVWCTININCTQLSACNTNMHENSNLCILSKEMYKVFFSVWINLSNNTNDSLTHHIDATSFKSSLATMNVSGYLKLQQPYRRVPGRMMWTQCVVLPGTHRFVRRMGLSLDTYFNSSPIYYLYVFLFTMLKQFLNRGSFIVHVLLLGRSKAFTSSVFMMGVRIHVVLLGTRRYGYWWPTLTSSLAWWARIDSRHPAPGTTVGSLRVRAREWSATWVTCCWGKKIDEEANIVIVTWVP